MMVLPLQVIVAPMPAETFFACGQSSQDMATCDVGESRQHPSWDPLPELPLGHLSAWAEAAAAKCTHGQVS